MNKFMLICAGLMLCALFANAQPPNVPADKGTVFGAEVTSGNALSAGEFEKKLNTVDSMNVKVQAKVLEVCPKKGCWFSLEMPDGTKTFVKMKDYAFFVPTALAGKTVVIEGEAKNKVISVGELKHYAEDAKKSKAEIDAITKPEREIRLTAAGIVVVE